MKNLFSILKSSKSKLVLIILLQVLFLSNLNANNINKSIILKIKDKSELNNYKNQIEFFKNILNENNQFDIVSKKLIDSNLLIAYKRKVNNKINNIEISKNRNKKNSVFNDELQNAKRLMSKVTSLERIFKIDLISKKSQVSTENQIDIQTIVNKLKKNENFEYIEIEAKRDFCVMPNDTNAPFQYYHEKINLYNAWDLINSKDSLLLGIVDSGVDYTHLDLSDNIWTNPGEQGLDSLGKDKSTNEIDDDKNGYVDDFKGWDFASSTGKSGEDNNPMPANSHGTHVAGIANAVTNNLHGIAGIAKNTKILVVKLGADDGSPSVSNSYNGLLYASLMNCDVINCSWGGASASESEQDIIDIVIEAGSTIVAAAGNDNRDQAFYPASYKGVISVGASDNSDYKADFSNYNTDVDVAAPGRLILSTIPKDTYSQESGTSMASPVVAGVACLLKLKNKNYTNYEIEELLKLGADNIDTNTQSYVGKFGMGRVNAFKSLSIEKPNAISFVDFKFSKLDNRDEFFANDTVYLSVKIKNLFSDIPKFQLSIKDNNVILPIDPIKVLDTLKLDSNLLSNESREYSKIFKFVIPENVGENRTYELMLNITGDNLKFRKILSFLANPSYRLMDANNIRFTVNSRGNIGYNDYPTNIQGDGFRYINEIIQDSIGKSNYGDNLLYEGSLIIATSKGRISDISRASNQSYQQRDFKYDNIVKLTNEKNSKTLLANAEFRDFRDSILYADSIRVGVSVKQQVLQIYDSNSKLKDAIILIYDVINQREELVDSLYLGLYFDWDLGANLYKDKVKFLNDQAMGIVYNILDSTRPYIGMLQLSDHKLSFYAMDNGAQDSLNFGVHDGFSRKEKIRSITNGLLRLESSVTDVSAIIGAGPAWIKAKDTSRFVFGLICNRDENKVKSIASELRDFVKISNITSGDFSAITNQDKILEIYPNPISSNFKTLISLKEPSQVEISLNDLSGKSITIYKNKLISAGLSLISLNQENLAKGEYYLTLKTQTSLISKKVIISY